MGISSTKRGIRTWAASQEYRDNWDRIFGEPACDPPEACATHGRCWTHSYWEDEGPKEKAPTPVEPRPVVWCSCGAHLLDADCCCVD